MGCNTMSIYKKLINNSLIFAVGSLGSKLIVFLLVPLYTYYLSKNEFGTVDLLTITINLLIPIFSLSISDAVLRFVMDKNYDKKQVLNNSFFISILGFLIILFLYPLIKLLFPFRLYIGYFYVILLFQTIYLILTQYIRANGMIKLFALTGIFHAFVLFIFNIIFLAGLKMSIDGYLFSTIIAYVLASLLIIIYAKVYNDFDVKKINIPLMRKMLLYSIPLMPNAIMWWIMSFSDRYLITYFLGLSANGLYAVASKIPIILTIINSVFFQAWQMSAIEEANSKEKSEFFSKVFNTFSILMLISTSLLLVLLKTIMTVLVSEDYYESWKYIPFLLLGVVFSSYASFLGTNYIASKKTSGVFKTSIIGAGINIIANIILIPKLGINGAALATMISFAVIWILRIIDTRQFVVIKIDVLKMILSLMILYFQIYILHLNHYNEYIIQLVLLFFIVFINRKEIKELVTGIKKSIV